MRPYPAPILADEIVIVGGGCYGTFYARQLERARARGALTVRRVLVVDRDPACQLTRDLPPAFDRELVVQDWDGFFDAYLASPPPRVPAHSYIVPTPLMPHLMFNWLVRRARALWPGREVRQEALTEPVGTPYDTLAPDGTRYVSWADWLCPTHCIEPATCPIIRAPRTWEMADTATALVARLARSRAVEGPALFVTRHITDGVGAFTLGEALAAETMLRTAGASGEPSALLIGTVSACHGALGLLALR
ncbi:MAG TPA: hypothetical protein PK948_04385 [Gemmatimonadales bacterium]|nr:hypothetical protein [Gemmatimonadales bacterium]